MHEYYEICAVHTYIRPNSTHNISALPNLELYAGMCNVQSTHYVFKLCFDEGDCVRKFKGTFNFV